MNKKWLFALGNEVNKLLKNITTYALLLVAKIVNIIPQQNRSILHDGITKNSQSSEKDIKLHLNQILGADVTFDFIVSKLAYP